MFELTRVGLRSDLFRVSLKMIGLRYGLLAELEEAVEEAVEDALEEAVEDEQAEEEEDLEVLIGEEPADGVETSDGCLAAAAAAEASSLSCKFQFRTPPNHKSRIRNRTRLHFRFETHLDLLSALREHLPSVFSSFRRASSRERSDGERVSDRAEQSIIGPRGFFHYMV